MKNPVPLSQVPSVFSCPYMPPSTCNPRNCYYDGGSSPVGEVVMMSCVSCPDLYPWTGNPLGNINWAVTTTQVRNEIKFYASAISTFCIYYKVVFIHGNSTFNCELFLPISNNTHSLAWSYGYSLWPLCTQYIHIILWLIVMNKQSMRISAILVSIFIAHYAIFASMFEYKRYYKFQFHSSIELLFDEQEPRYVVSKVTSMYSSWIIIYFFNILF